ncbi:hypothetical protein UlMin_019350 [Ulmus minor]
MITIFQYLAHNQLPRDKNEARCLLAKVARFTILDGQLLRRSFSGPYLKCVMPTEANYVLAELHEGACGNYFGEHSLANRALMVGYYWPTMRSDSISFVQKCDSCHRFAQIVTNNGSQFISHEFHDFCKEWGIKLNYSTPRYPQANG